jgi:flagellar motor switch protein FliM
MVNQASKRQNEWSEGYDPSSVKIYDFKKALRLSMEHVRGLTKIHETFGYRLSSTLSDQLRTIVQVEVISVEQILYEEFIQQLPSSTLLSEFQAVNQEMRMALNLNPQMGFAMIDRLLGGKGALDHTVRSSLTPIENNVLKGLLEGFVQNLQKAWADILSFKLKVLDIKTNPQFLQLAAPEETVIVILFHLTIGQNKEQMQLCIPFNYLEPVNAKLSPLNWIGNGQSVKSKEDSGLIQERIEHLTVPVCAELGRASITIEEFLELAVNDVIQLDQLVDEPLKVRINEQIKFLAHPGTKKSRMAVKIEQALEGEDNND